ncbi:MAG: NAD-dependent epimerase/dehydratase [Tannerella sp.]|jgi:CDP-paratose synthetase|nr:NAD-dependent epimerase/dehydratase [Tannerella sp.]
MERLLITGATGFIGQNLVPEIINQFPGIKILTLNKCKDKAMDMFPFNPCEHVKGLPMETIKRFNPEIAFHLATFTTAENSFDFIRPMVETNITFGTELLSILGDCPGFKLFVNTGSFSEYSDGTEKINDAYLYSATKSAFRVFVDYYSRLKGFKYITATPYSVYGGKPTVKRLMDYLIESINAEKPVSMTGGEQVLDFIHINDVTSFFIHILKNPALLESLHNGTEFHLGTGIGTSIKDLASMVEEISGGKCNIQWGGRLYREQDIMYAIAPPTSKNRERINWSARIALKEGISTMLIGSPRFQV